MMVHVEATGLARASREDLQVLAVEDQRRGFPLVEQFRSYVQDPERGVGWVAEPAEVRPA